MRTFWSTAFILFGLAASLQAQNTPRALSMEARTALIEALAADDGKYAERAKYTAIVEKFGQVQPYAMIKMSETYQISALEAQLKRYGVALPTDRHSGKTLAPSSLAEAAVEAVKMEERSIVLFERLQRSVADNPELGRLMQNLQRASREGHLAAFKAAAENGGKLTMDQMRQYQWRGRRAAAGGNAGNSQ